MTSHGSSDFDMKLSGHVPILWKRKVRNFIKKDRQQALEIFLGNFMLGKDPKQMQYGLEQLLPDSLHRILSSVEESTQEVKVSLFYLLSSPPFLSHISTLNQEKQEILLNQIHNIWDTGLERDLIQEILFQIEPTLITILYGKIQESESTQIVEIMKLWGFKILQNVLELYIKTPIASIRPLFKELEPNKRVELFQEANLIAKLQLQNIIQLMSPTEIDLNYLLASKHTKTVDSRKLIHDWLTTQKISRELLLRVYQQIKSEETLGFIVEYFFTCIKQNLCLPEEVIISILSYKEDLIAHKLLRELNSLKENQPLEILVSCLKKLEDEVSQYTQFFESEFKMYGNQNLELILLTYLESPFESHHQLLIPFLQDAAVKNWKTIITTALETKRPPTPEQVFTIFIKCSKRTKRNIGNYIINESLVKEFAFLFSDFEIFQSALVNPKGLAVSVQTLLDPFLRQHVSESFENIIRLGQKITFSKLAFSSIMDESSLHLLLTTIGNKTELLNFWEEIFLFCSNESLKIVLLHQVTNQRKKMDYLNPLLYKLIELETLKFWTILRSIDKKDLTRIEPIMNHAFEISIPMIGEVLLRLPEDHLSFVIKHIIPQFASSGSKLLYSLFSIQDIPNIEQQVIFTILETIQLNPEDLLTISLVRSSKLINNPTLGSFIPNLMATLFSNYSTEVFLIIDSQKLRGLVPVVKKFLSGLPDSELEATLLPLVNTLVSNVLNGLILESLSSLSKNGEDLRLLERMLANYESAEFTSEGKRIVQDYLNIIVGKSANRDLLIFASFRGRPRSQAQFLQYYFSRTSLQTIESILHDSPDPLEENMLKSIVNHFETNPPESPEEYFLSLYQSSRGKEDIQRAVLPLLGEFCSWHNLSKLMEFQDKEKYQKEYQKALIKFSSRFDIQSPRALEQIWISGLKQVYDRLKEPGSLFQSQCPQCGNPILENQKNCGFCSQRLTCIICRKSVVQLHAEEIVQCPQCSSFFHRRHLQESVKIQKKCPVCNVKLRAAEVESLPLFTFFYK
ncbi:MAG: RING finger protein [Promethearchaeota archaeon]